MANTNFAWADSIRMTLSEAVADSLKTDPSLARRLCPLFVKVPFGISYLDCLQQV